MSITVVYHKLTVHIPREAGQSLSAFRTWVGSDDVPEKARTDFYKGRIWVDITTEPVFSHCAVKTEFVCVLGNLSRDFGNYWSSGVLVTNEAASLSGNPDGLFVSHNSAETGKVQFTKSPEGGHDEIVGTVDMVLEIVRDKTADRDSVTLRQAYWEAGIPEYWLVDARGQRLEFHILKHGPKGYTDARKAGGWLKSAVFGKSFQLTRTRDPQGNPEFTLDVK